MTTMVDPFEADAEIAHMEALLQGRSVSGAGVV